MLVPSPKWLDTGSNAWQMAAATFVGLQSVPGLVVLYGGIVKRKWAINSAFMAMYAFAAVMVVWVLWAYNMSFGEQWFPFWGKPQPAISAAFLLQQATIPAAASGMPPLAFPMATMMFFQFVFAAITVIILAGSLIGRMSFKAWIIFVPLWMTFVYTVGAFSIWGGGWLAQLGAVDYSGGYVIHLAAGTSGFVAAAVIGPRLQRDRDEFLPNNVLMALAGAGILWLGWNGFNGGDPYFANSDAAAAVLNTNIATAVALLVWLIADYFALGHPNAVSMINGMIAGLVAITPCAGYVNGFGAILVGIATIIPWLTITFVSRWSLLKRVDDTFSVLHTHGVAGLVGGLMAGLVADPNMVVYPLAPGPQPKGAAAVSVTGLFYGNPAQFVDQIEAAAFIIVWNAVATFVLLKVIGLIVPLRASEDVMEAGDLAIHGMEPMPLPGISGA